MEKFRRKSLCKQHWKNSVQWRATRKLIYFLMKTQFCKINILSFIFIMYYSYKSICSFCSHIVENFECILNHFFWMNHPQHTHIHTCTQPTHTHVLTHKHANTHAHTCTDTNTFICLCNTFVKCSSLLCFINQE